VSKRKLLSSGKTSGKTEHKTATAHSHSLETAFAKHEKKILFGITILLLLIPLILAVLFRMPTYELPITDTWARNSLDGNMRNAISTQIDQQYPNLPSQNKQQLVDEKYAELMKDPAAQQQYEDQAAQYSAYFKSQLRDENGHTYLPDLDTYYHLLRIEQILENGYPGDTEIDGNPWNMHMLAPFGSETNADFYSWFVAKTYRIQHAFDDSTTPLYTYFWMPLLFACLMVIPAFFIGKREGLIAGFFAAMLVAIHPGVIGRTAAGFADTDILVVFFPLFLAWFFLEAFEAPLYDWKRRGLWMLLLGITFGLFAWVWNWWFFFDIFLFVVFAYILYLAARTFLKRRSFGALFRDDEIRWSGVMLLGFIVAAGIFVSLFIGIDSFVHGPLGAFSQSADFKDAVSAGSIWPNVMTTVAELNEPSIAGIVSSLGGKFLFLLGLMGMLFAMVPRDKLSWKEWCLLAFGLAVYLFLLSERGMALSILWFILVMAIPLAVGGFLLLKEDRGIDVKYAFLIAAWFAASIFTMTKGVRFVLLVVPPLTIGAAITIGVVFSLVKRWLVKENHLSRLWIVPLLFLVLCLPLVSLMVQGANAGKQGVPHMTDAWWAALTDIKNTSAPDAIITSWWDFGHWFKYVSDRPVTFDGASQRGELAHFIGRALLTPDEREAMAILRMVDCGSDHGVALLQEKLPSNDQYEAIMLTKQLILMKHEAARELLLSKGLSGDDADAVLKLTHCEPPEAIFITSSDMIGKGGVWGHFGGWDFARADAYQHFKSLPQAEAVPQMAAKYGWTTEQASKIYFEMQTLADEQAVNAWISPWPGYVMQDLRACGQSTQFPELFVCPFNANVGNQQGTNIVLESLLLNKTDRNNSFLSIGFYNGQGQRVGANTEVKPSSLVFISNTSTERVVFSGQTFGQSFVIDDRNPAKPAVLMADPANAEALFTKLYFLDGAGTTAFTKSGEYSDFMGDRIVVWKVDWTKLKSLGLE